LKDFFQYQDEEDYIKQQLKPLNLDLQELRQKGWLPVPQKKDKTANEKEITFNTPSGKIEIYSETLKKAGFSAWPTWEEPSYPKPDEFYLLTGKVGQHTQMGTQNNPLLHKYEDKPRLWLHTSAAKERSVQTDDVVRVTSEVGEVLVAVLVTETIRPDCVYLTPGYGHLSKGLRVAYKHGVSDSELHVTYTDPISGGQALSQTFVKVQKA
jgi:thiosulfate reductase/polysulfide reductase chain A